MIYLLLKEKKANGGCNLKLGKRLASKQILAMFPLHEEDVVKKLKAANWTPWSLPLWELKKYVGEGAAAAAAALLVLDPLSRSAQLLFLLLRPLPLLLALRRQRLRLRTHLALSGTTARRSACTSPS